MPTATQPAATVQLLAHVPELCGFVPHQSLVLLQFAGGQSRGALRVDLPNPLDGAMCGSVAGAAVSAVARASDIDELIAVIYTDLPFGSSPPGARLVDRMRHLADLAGIRLGDAITVTADAWGSHFDPETPVGGHPLDA